MLQFTFTQSPDLSPLLNVNLPMRDIGLWLETNVIQNFNQQKSPSNIPWLPSQRAVSDGGKTLIDTGAMLASLSMIHGADFVEVGFPAGLQSDKARWHNFGTKHLPERPMLGMPDDTQKLHAIIKNYFETNLKQE